MSRIITILSFILSAAILALDPPPLRQGMPMPGLPARSDNLSKTVIPLMPESSRPAQWREIKGRPYIELPGTFAGNRAVRCGWDFRLKSDLKEIRQIEFDFFCSNSEIADTVNIYFHSGNGWYSTSFGVDGNSVWKHIVIDKGSMRIEENPDSWGSIDTMRIGYWRTKAGEGEATLGIANITVSAPRADVVLIPAESLISPKNSQSENIKTYASNFGKSLSNAGIRYITVSDKDLSAESLRTAKVAILPCNPKISEENLELLREFVSNGGKLITTFQTPPSVLKLLDAKAGRAIAPKGGIFSAILATDKALPAQPETAFQTAWTGKQIVPIKGSHQRVIATWRSPDGTNSNVPAVSILDKGAYFGYVWNGGHTAEGDRFILSVIAHFVPKILESAAVSEFMKIGRIAGFKSYDEFRSFLQSRKELQADAARLETSRNSVRASLDRKEWVAALDKTQEAAALASDLWFQSRSDRPGEFRAVWCHRAYGNAGYTWERSARILAENGFNNLIVNSTRAGTAYYPSKVIETYSGFDKHGDLLRQCLDACNKHGIKVHAWRTCFYMGRNVASREYISKMVAEKRVMVSSKGKVLQNWFCPSDPRNQTLEKEAFCELVRNYPDLTGVQFDYIRYCNENHCFCDGCRERFEKYAGVTIRKWPADLDQESLKEKWLRFRRDNITTVVRDTYKAVKAIRPSIQVSAAVLKNSVYCRVSVGQDWELWCRNGWLDFICPMSYFESNYDFESATKAQIPFTHGVPMYQGIGITLWNGTDPAIKAAEQIEIVRKYKLPGFVLFEFKPATISAMSRLHQGLLK